jgi:Uma2 family endonuclease
MSTAARLSLAQYDRMIDAGVFDARKANRIGFPELKSAPQPDVAWVTKKFSARRPQGSEIFLIIEVAQTRLAYDRGEKARLYAKAGVRDYWVMNIPERCVEVFRDPLRGRYKTLRTYATGEDVRPLAFPDACLSVSSLFSSIDSPDDRNSSL